MKRQKNKKTAILVYYFAPKQKTLHNRNKKVLKKVLTFQKLHSIIQNVPHQKGTK